MTTNNDCYENELDSEVDDNGGGIFNNTDDDHDGDDSDNDDDEFSHFISSKWKDSVEIGLIVNYPLPCTNYLLNSNSSLLLTSATNNDAAAIATAIATATAPANNCNYSQCRRLPSLKLSTRLEEQSIAPLFDGTQWAGTRIWKAAVLGLEYIIRLRLLQQQQQKQQRRINQNKNNINSTKDARAASDINDNDDNYYKQYSSLLELGCGLGVPSMIWKQLLLHDDQKNDDTNNSINSTKSNSLSPSVSSFSPRVVATDRDSLLTQLQMNIETNFRTDSDCCDNSTSVNGSNNIAVKALDWSDDGIKILLEEESLLLQQRSSMSSKDDKSNYEKNNKEKEAIFDICLNCDCVYEPLYGRKSWESLADVLIQIAKSSPRTLLVTSVERRNSDNLEGFLHKLTISGAIQVPIDCAVRDTTDPHHVIEIYTTKGIY